MAGETLEFEGDISPDGGFVNGWIENELGHKVAELHTTQITDDFNIKLKTNGSFFNGTYKAHINYVQYANGTTCGASIVGSTFLKTNTTVGEVDLNIVLSQSYNTSPFELQGAPVETPLGSINTVIKGSAVQGLAPSIKLHGTQLVAGTNLGSLDILLSICQQNEEVMSSYSQVSDFLNGSFADIVKYERALESEQLKFKALRLLYINVTGKDEGGVRIPNKVGELDRAKNELKRVEGIAAARWEWWIAIPLLLLGAVLMRVAQIAMEKSNNNQNKPQPYTKKNSLPKI